MCIRDRVSTQSTGKKRKFESPTPFSFSVFSQKPVKYSSRPFSTNFRYNPSSSKKEAKLAESAALFPCNQDLVEMMETVEKEFDVLLSQLKTVKLWLSLITSKKEEKDFHMAVREEVLQLLSSFETNSVSVLSSIGRTCAVRGHLVEKAIKYEMNDEIMNGIVEYDQKIFLFQKKTFLEMRNALVVIADFLNKNTDSLLLTTTSSTETCEKKNNDSN
eukprot:TRINITY_DN3736_c0_g1_i1.p1 TRINITY_DN3736_c0_g1~~TRINITY_DN3736_c0_g1_i1.p1  ORF type:complete len:217 (-),score=48.61 TRINITY_DN3736_c0_g1_i1:93-743(-)